MWFFLQKMSWWRLKMWAMTVSPLLVANNMPSAGLTESFRLGSLELQASWHHCWIHKPNVSSLWMFVPTQAISWRASSTSWEWAMRAPTICTCFVSPTMKPRRGESNQSQQSFIEQFVKVSLCHDFISQSFSLSWLLGQNLATPNVHQKVKAQFLGPKSLRRLKGPDPTLKPQQEQSSLLIRFQPLWHTNTQLFPTVSSSRSSR